MPVGLLGRKVGMTQVYTDDGDLIPVTVVEAGPCVVLQLNNPQLCELAKRRWNCPNLVGVQNELRQLREASQFRRQRSRDIVLLQMSTVHLR